MSLLTSLANTAIASGAASGVSKPVLSASRPIVEEGDEVHFTLYVPDGVEGTTYAYSITGITANDLFYGTLTGNFTLNSVESANVTIILARDDAEEVETITMTVDSLNVSVQVTITDTTPAPVGESIYDYPGNYQWVCPAGVTSVSVVAIGGGGNGGYITNTNGSSRAGGGGGGLGWKNNIAVTPGTSYPVVVTGWYGQNSSPGATYFSSYTLVSGNLGSSAYSSYNGQAGGSYIGDGGGVGGASKTMSSATNSRYLGGGGGGGGYLNAGGAGGALNSAGAGSNTGGGGGGSGYYVHSYNGAGGFGGGTGLFGTGGGSPTSGGAYAEYAGSGGMYNPVTYPTTGNWVNNTSGYGRAAQRFGGGGGALTSTNLKSNFGGPGGVRIMWGSGRSFPNNAEYRDPDAGVATTLEYTLTVPLDRGDGEFFGFGVALSGRYAAIGSPGGAGVDIFDVTNGQLLYTLTGLPKFGTSVCIEGKYLAVGSSEETHPANGKQYSGAVHVYDITTGELLHTMRRPDPPTLLFEYYGTTPPRISGVHMIVGSPRIPSVAAGGRVWIYELVNGSLLHTIDNPNIDASGADDDFGQSVDISGNYAIVGARYEDRYEGGVVSSSGNAYIINVTTGAVIKVLDNPNAPGTTANSDQFGTAVAMSGNYAIVSAYTEDVGGSSSGSVYIFKTTSGDWSDATVIHSIHNPTTGDATSDFFGISVDISGNYAIVGAYGSESGTNAYSGKVYIFDVVNGTLVSNITNPTPFENDYFGSSVAMSGNYALVGAYGDWGLAGYFTGRSYIYKLTQ